MNEINIWPGWHIVRVIGSGSFGTVYEIHRGEGPYLERAALKVIRIPSSPVELEQLRADGIRAGDTESYLINQVEDIRGEIGLMQRFVGFSNIVSYEDYMIRKHSQGVGWDVFIRMELLTALSSVMAVRSMTEKDVLKLGLDISQALMICHSAGIIHRDIKPQNIFINSLGFYKLGDFGISRPLSRTGSAISFKGTVSYMAPETFSMRSSDTRSDIYSLALVMYRILNGGREPFLPSVGITPAHREAAQNRRLRGELLPPPCSGSREIWEVLSVALSPNPQARYQTAEQFRAALGRLLPMTDRGKAAPVLGGSSGYRDQPGGGADFGQNRAIPGMGAFPGDNKGAAGLGGISITGGKPGKKRIPETRAASGQRTVSGLKKFWSGNNFLYGILAVMVVLLLGSVTALLLSPFRESAVKSTGNGAGKGSEAEAASGGRQNAGDDAGTGEGIQSMGSEAVQMVSYMVVCVDEKERTLRQHSYLGVAGKRITVEAEEIEGYVPKNKSESILLSEDEAENAIVFRYREDASQSYFADGGSGAGSGSASGSGGGISDGTGPTVRLVSYYVLCEDAGGSFSYETSYEGLSGRTITVPAPVIDGYKPRSQEETLYLSEDEDENYLTFVYDEDPDRIPAGTITYNGHHYFACRSSGIDSFWEADSYSRSLGGYLAVINNADENRALYNYVFRDLGYKSAYFGYTDDGSEGSWYWAGGDTSSYENWADKQPDNRHDAENYALFYYTDPEYKWNDGDFGKDSNGEVIFLIEWE